MEGAGIEKVLSEYWGGLAMQTIYAPKRIQPTTTPINMAFNTRWYHRWGLRKSLLSSGLQ